MAARLPCLARSGDQPGNRAAGRLPGGPGLGAYVPEGMKLLLVGGHLLVSCEASSPSLGHEPQAALPSFVTQAWSLQPLQQNSCHLTSRKFSQIQQQLAVTQPNPDHPSHSLLSEHIWESTFMQHVCVCMSCNLSMKYVDNNKEVLIFSRTYYVPSKLYLMWSLSTDLHNKLTIPTLQT